MAWNAQRLPEVSFGQPGSAQTRLAATYALGIA
jgi:hypothetical protein